MLVERFVKLYFGRSRSVTLVIGSAISAFTISLGFICVCRFLALPVNVAAAVAFGAIGAAIYAKRTYHRN